MWQVLETTEYFVKYNTIYQNEVYVTDFTRIWYLYLTQEQFLNALQEANPILEMTDADFLRKGKEMLLIPKNYQSIHISKQDTNLQLSLVKKLPFKLKLELELNSGSREMFFQQVTQALLLTVNELKCSQLELRIQLNKKDKEIDEYKCKGVEISAKTFKGDHSYVDQLVNHIDHNLAKIPTVSGHLKTNKFNESEHLSKYKMYEENFGATSIPEFLLKIPVKIKNEELTRKEDPITQTVEVKAEPRSQPNEVNIKERPKPIEVKTEQNTQMDDTAMHSFSSNGGHLLGSERNREVKTELQTQTSEVKSDVKIEELSQNALTESNNIKQEINNRIFSPKKKMKRLNL